MRVGTSVTLPQELLVKVDELAGVKRKRSDFVEAALQAYINGIVRRQRNVRDLEILNRYADELNAEAMDTLEYQAEW